MKATTTDLYSAERARWRAWSASLKGSTKHFYAFNPDCAYPAAYGVGVFNLTRHGGGAFVGTCTLTATAAGTLSLSALPDEYVFTDGDHISIGMTGLPRSLHVVTEPATASLTGTATVSVGPPVRSGANLGVAVQLVEASCEMVLVPGSFSAPATGFLSKASFEASQVLI